jgi:hypothetical protein
MAFYQDRELRARQAEREKALICGRGARLAAGSQHEA